MELEQRIEQVEVDMGLIKGEIQQVLVELKELVLKQTGPFPDLSSVSPLSIPRDAAPNYEARIQSIPAESRDELDQGSGEQRSTVPPMLDVQTDTYVTPSSQVIQAPPPPKVVEIQPPAQISPPISESSSTAPPGIIEQPVTTEAEGDANGTWLADGTAKQAEQESGHQQPLTPNGVAPERSEDPQSSGPTIHDLVFVEGQGTLMERRGDEAEAAERPVAGRAMAVHGLDANVATNLVRWVSDVRPRIGVEQLEAFLGVYKLTGHLPQAIEQFILQAANLEALPDSSVGPGFTLEDFGDCLLKLNGIVYRAAVD